MAKNKSLVDCLWMPVTAGVITNVAGGDIMTAAAVSAGISGLKALTQVAGLAAAGELLTEADQRIKNMAAGVVVGMCLVSAGVSAGISAGAHKLTDIAFEHKLNKMAIVQPVVENQMEK